MTSRWDDVFVCSCNTASDFAQKGFRSVDADASEPKILHFHTRSGNPTEFDISDAACLPFGFRHGETIIVSGGPLGPPFDPVPLWWLPACILLPSPFSELLWCVPVVGIGPYLQTDKGKRSVVVGVSKNNLWLLLEGDPGASYWSSLRQKSDFDSRGFRSCPVSPIPPPLSRGSPESTAVIMKAEGVPRMQENPMTAVFSLDWYTLGAAGD